MRQLYAERRATLAEALSDEVPSLSIELKPGGMHLMARLPRKVDDVKLVDRLKKAGMAPSPLSICGVERSYAPGFVIGFTNVETGKARQAARVLGSALADLR
jgi:GntR family transcriptional regulator/MocR family aminotransferase